MLGNRETVISDHILDVAIIKLVLISRDQQEV